MSYDPTRQYRCTIIRGKAKSDLDNLLPAYARIVSEVTPASVEDFNQKFNDSLNQLLGGVKKKTLDNHRTEIAYKLFGLFYVDDEGIVQMGQRTAFFLENNDQPQFFKDICFRFQQPNGMDSIQTVLDKVEHQVKIKPLAFVLSLLTVAKQNNIVLSKREIAYYALNSLDVLQGTVTSKEVLETIISHRGQGIVNKVEEPGKASSYNVQHINEQLNLLELANLIVVNSNQDLVINEKENEAISLFIDSLDQPLAFAVDSYDLSQPDDRKAFYRDWDKYFTALTEGAQEAFETSADSLGSPVSFDGERVSGRDSTIALGDEGELYIYNYERNRVTQFNQRLVNKIKWVGSQRGLGYDIQSIFAIPGEFAEFAKYIEVKSTKRVTAPRLDDETWEDSIGMTRNEVVAAQQHKNAYHIYRVYFTRDAVTVYVIQNPYDKAEEHLLYLKPTQYRLEFSARAVDSNF